MIFRWGCTHEKDATDAYSTAAMKDHHNLQIFETGFFIDATYPFIGASPDGIMNCICCGKEVKCPYCSMDGLPEEEKENFCMIKQNGNWQLKRDHTYYYQIQMQMNVCQVPHCEFVVWTENGIAVERVPADDVLLMKCLIR